MTVQYDLCQTLLQTQIIIFLYFFFSFIYLLRRLKIRHTYCDDGHCDSDDNSSDGGDDEEPLFSNISTIQIFISRQLVFNERSVDW